SVPSRQLPRRLTQGVRRGHHWPRSYRAGRFSPYWRRNMALSARLLSTLFFSAIAACAVAQTQPEFQPEVGQQGKDVVWVPSPQELVNKMLDMAKLTPKDFLMDLGSGDGRTVITAAKRGAHALGIEYNPNMVALSRKNAEKAGVASKASFQE